MKTTYCKLIDAAAGRHCFPWHLAPRSAWPLLMLPPLLLLGATPRAVAQTMGFSVGFSSQVTRGVSVSSEVEVRSGRGFYLEGENVTPVDGSTSTLAGDTGFQIRNPAEPFSLVQQDLTGENIRTAESQSSTFSAGRSTNLSVFSNF